MVCGTVSTLAQPVMPPHHQFRPLGQLISQTEQGIAHQLLHLGPDTAAPALLSPSPSPALQLLTHSARVQAAVAAAAAAGGGGGTSVQQQYVQARLQVAAASAPSAHPMNTVPATATAAAARANANKADAASGAPSRIAYPAAQLPQALSYQAAPRVYDAQTATGSHGPSLAEFPPLGMVPPQTAARGGAASRSGGTH